MVIQPKAPSSCPVRSSAPQKSTGERPRARLTAAKMSSARELFFWLCGEEQQPGLARSPPYGTPPGAGGRSSHAAPQGRVRLPHLSSLMPAVAPRNVGVSLCWALGISASASSRQPCRLSPACAGSEV